MRLKALTLILAASAALGGCGSLFNGERDAMTVAERHPITVDQQTVTIAVPIDATLSGLSRDSLRTLDGFLSGYRARGHGPITVTAPTGTSRDRDAQQTAANVRQALNALGLEYAEMLGATYRASDASNGVMVSYTRYVASGPECGVFGNELVNKIASRRAPNFGCADQHNLAAMVSDPKDLVAMQKPAPSNGSGLAAATRVLSSGEANWGGDGAYGAGIGE